MVMAPSAPCLLGIRIIPRTRCRSMRTSVAAARRFSGVWHPEALNRDEGFGTPRRQNGMDQQPLSAASGFRLLEDVVVPRLVRGDDRQVRLGVAGPFVSPDLGRAPPVGQGPHEL